MKDMLTSEKDNSTTIRNLKKGLIWFGILINLLVGFMVYLMIANSKLSRQIFELSNNINNQVFELSHKVSTIEHPITYKPLIFEADEDGFAKINSIMLGFEKQQAQMIYVQEYLPHNPIIEEHDPLYAHVKIVEENIPETVNHFLKIDRQRRLILKPGYYYLRTNLGDFRILVLEKGISELQKFFRFFYFYTSLAAHGRSANAARGKKMNYLIGNDALQFVFYSNYYSGNFCTGHQLLFQFLFEDYFEKTRKIDFYGFLEDETSEKKDTQSSVGHSVLEVYVDGKWIVVDPMAGFIPFDENGEKPLSFIEFLQARRTNSYIVKALFHVPNFGFDMEDPAYVDKFDLDREEYRRLREKYGYLANTPLKGEFFNYLTKRDFEYLWSGIELLVYIIDDEGYFFMEKDIYDNMAPDDWERYKEHYQGLINRYSPSELKKLINLNIEDLYR